MLLDEWERSGGSAAQFADYVGIKYSTLANWIQNRRKQAGLKPIFNSQRQFLLGRCSPGAASRAIAVLRPQKCSAISLPKSFSTLL
jgi:hypothetical protein